MAFREYIFYIPHYSRCAYIYIGGGGGGERAGVHTFCAWKAMCT